MGKKSAVVAGQSPQHPEQEQNLGSPTAVPWGPLWDAPQLQGQLVERGKSPRLSPKGAAGGRGSAEGEFAPSRGLWKAVSEPDAPAVGTERDGISLHLGKKERKSPV